MKNTQKRLKKRLYLALIALIFACLSSFTYISSAFATNITAETNTTETNTTETNITETTTDTIDTPEASPDDTKKTTENTCAEESGAIGWLVCPTTGVISKIVDGIYSLIGNLLNVEPISTEAGSPIRIVWSYIRNITNIIFIIVLLIVVWSQVTGIGISNYGIKRLLPRIVVTAILVNLSFIICQLGVDISNIIGAGLRGFFENIEESVIASGAAPGYDVSWSDVVDLLITGVAIADIEIVVAGGLVGSFYALLPLLLAALVSVGIGLITISMRQAIVLLLTMASPLAIVCNLLPNTESWYKKWKDLFLRMLIFYPAFSFLYGACHLVGWSLIAASDNLLGIIIGLVIQVYPLFASWSLMKMSGTILGSINDRLHGIAARPLGAINRSLRTSQELARAKYAANKPKGLGQAVLQKIQDDAYRQASDTKRYNDVAGLRSQANAAKITNARGRITRRAEQMEALNTRSLKYQTTIAKSANDYNKGLSMLEYPTVGAGQRARLEALDSEIVQASDSLKYELARGAQIEYRNTVGYQNRTQAAIDAHMDTVHSGEDTYQLHNLTPEERASALKRFKQMQATVEGHIEDVHFIGADAAQIYGAQTGAIQKKYQAYFDLTAPTQDVVHRLSELTIRPDSTAHIDEIIGGLRTLNMRGDTDLVKKVIDETLVDADGSLKVKLGTYASQSLANFLMFDVKNSDPFLRRFGKYINLETARVYNEAEPSKRRHNDELSFDEYITGEYVDYDENGHEIVGHSKRTAKILLEGTSFKDIERTGYANMIQSITKACRDKDGHVDHEKCERIQDEIYNATLANLIGDSLSYLSGSEQITSFAQFITGIKKDKDGRYVEDFLDIDKADFDSMSPEDQEALMEHKRDYYRKRADLFITSHVPSQMGRFKSDIFASARQMYRNLAEGNLTDAERAEYNAITDTKAREEYLDDHGAKTAFKKAIKPKTYEYLQKMYNRGYLSDAKAPISAYLDLDKQPAPSNTIPNDDEDAGLAPEDTTDESLPTSATDALLASVSIELDNIIRSYSTPTDRHRVAEFLDDVINLLAASGIDQATIDSVTALRRELSIHTDISTLAAEIKNILK